MTLTVSYWIDLIGYSQPRPRPLLMVSHPRQKSTFYIHHNFLFATQLFVHNM